jgi:hypothetical protein
MQVLMPDPICYFNGEIIKNQNTFAPFKVQTEFNGF